MSATAHDQTALLNALRVHLQEELGLHRQLLTLAEEKRERIVAGQIKEFSQLLQQEQQHLEAGQHLRRRREEILRRLATEIRLTPDRLRMAQLLERAPEPLRGQLSGLQNDLVLLLNRLREVNDRNMLLIRQSLSFVQELMGVVFGAGRTEDYDRSGDNGPAKGGGRLADYQA